MVLTTVLDNCITEDATLKVLVIDNFKVVFIQKFLAMILAMLRC